MNFPSGEAGWSGGYQKPAQQVGLDFQGLNAESRPIRQWQPPLLQADEPFLTGLLSWFFNQLPWFARAGIEETCDTQAQDHKQPVWAGDCCSSRFSLEMTSSTPQIATCLFATHFVLQWLFSFDSKSYLPVSTQSHKSFSDRGAFAPPQKCMAMSGDILVATSILWVETKDTTKHTTVLRTTPQQRIIQPQMSTEPRVRDPALEEDQIWGGAFQAPREEEFQNPAFHSTSQTSSSLKNKIKLWK